MTSGIKEIIDVNIKEVLKPNVFKQLKDSSEIPFLSKESVTFLEKYVDETAKEEDVKKLWKSLLIDAICFLKINDSREKYNQSSKGLLKSEESTPIEQEEFIKKFDSNRKLSSYGIDNISKYFDDFIKFESVLYGTDEYYRNHVDHVFKVWAMGLSLIRHSDVDLSDGAVLEKKLYSFKCSGEGLYVCTGEIYAMWTIIALCHDLGYPIEKSYKINEKLKNILKYFGNINIQEFSYNFNLFNNYLVEKFLNIVSSKAVLKEKCTQLQSKYRDKLAKSIEDYKHGVFSALLIFKSLTYFLETDYTYPNQTISLEDLRQFYIRKEILRAISGHTCPKLYHLNLNTLSFMLILCDEMQEWKRPRFEDLKTGCIKNEPCEIKIEKFNKEEITALMIYKVESDTEIDELLLIAKNEKEPSKDNSREGALIQEKKSSKAYNNYAKHVIRKFQMFHNLLRSAKDDSIRKFKFEFKIEFKSSSKHITYRFKFDSNIDDAFEILKTQIIDIKKPIKDDDGNIVDFEEIGYLHIYD